jgi:hypothetical protein
VFSPAKKVWKVFKVVGLRDFVLKCVFLINRPGPRGLVK